MTRPSAITTGSFLLLVLAVAVLFVVAWRNPPGAGGAPATPPRGPA